MPCVFAHRLYTGRKVVDRAYLRFAGRRITGVSAARQGELVGEYPVVTPAFIDPHSHIGMHRAGEPSGESEANEQLDSILALADALDSVQLDDPAFGEAVEMGVLYSCVVPGSGNIVGGLAAVIRHCAADSTAALVARAGVKAAFGYNPMSTSDWKGTRPSTRMGALAVLRRRLGEVRQKVERHRLARGAKRREVVFSPEEELLRDLLAGRQRLRAHVHKIDDIAAVLRLADEFKLRLTVEHGLDVHEPATFAELARRRIPVTYGPIDAFAYKVELKHKSWRHVRLLVESGARYGLMTDHPVTPSSQLFLQTRWFTRVGLSRQEAIEVVCRRNAELLEIDDVLGTLERGRWASFTGWSGDPFDLTSYPMAVYCEGRQVVGAG